MKMKVNVEIWNVKFSKGVGGSRLYEDQQQRGGEKKDQCVPLDFKIQLTEFWKKKICYF